HIVDSDAGSIIDGIKQITFNSSYRNKLIRSLVYYSEKNDISKTTGMILHLYRKLMQS
ncbi:MAG: hypothetical protein GX640_04580, partial [Fibrobacter sp.]|nr:hypothetical protein [Fibrobacter sp.]